MIQIKMLAGKTLIFLIIIFSLNGTYAAEENPDLIIKRGLENCYSFKWKNAEKDFSSLIKNYSEDPRGYHYLSSIYLWYYMSSGESSDLDQFLKYSDIAIAKGEKILDENPDDQGTGYIMGNAYCYRTLGFAKSESYINAIWSSKKSEKYLKKVIEINPGFYDAYLGLGLYNFAAAQIPSAFKWALNLAGISGDEETGVKYIKLTAEKGTLSRVEAKYYLSQLLTGAIPEYQNAESLLEGLQRRYPDNILFSYGLAVIRMKQKNPDDAENLLKNIIVQDYPKFRHVISFSNFLLGDVYYRRNDYQGALDSYKKFLASSVVKDYSGIASLRAGICCEMLKNRSQALYYYSKTSSGNSDIEDDVYAKRKGRIFNGRELSDTEKLLVMYSGQVEGGKFKAAYQGLSDLLNGISNPALKAEACYYISEAAYYMGNKDESLKFALRGASSDAGEEGWLNALCSYNAARIYMDSGNMKMKVEFIEKAESQNSWDYENQIKNLLKSLKRQ